MAASVIDKSLTKYNWCLYSAENWDIIEVPVLETLILHSKTSLFFKGLSSDKLFFLESHMSHVAQKRAISVELKSRMCHV
jgi:hypothetical protein